jgi:hypothetical protein
MRRLAVLLAGLRRRRCSAQGSKHSGRGRDAMRLGIARRRNGCTGRRSGARVRRLDRSRCDTPSLTEKTISQRSAADARSDEQDGAQLGAGKRPPGGRRRRRVDGNADESREPLSDSSELVGLRSIRSSSGERVLQARRRLRAGGAQPRRVDGFLHAPLSRARVRA